MVVVFTGVKNCNAIGNCVRFFGGGVVEKGLVVGEDVGVSG